jgi:hypothetical protein
MVEKQTSHRLACIRSDRGGEYTSTAFIQYCMEKGIRRQLTAGYSPHQNGIAERKNRSILETMHSMAIEASLPSYLWDEAAKTACYILNRCPTKALTLVTPEERFLGKKPDFSHLRIYGATAYVHIPREKHAKLERKAIRTTLVGYDDLSKAYRCFGPTTRKIFISKDVVFDETCLGLASTRPYQTEFYQNLFSEPKPNKNLRPLSPSEALETPQIPQIPSQSNNSSPAYSWDSPGSLVPSQARILTPIPSPIQTISQQPPLRRFHRFRR